MRRIIGVAVLAACVSLGVSQEAYSTWTKHRNIILNTASTGASIPAAVTGFPVLVRLAAKDSVFAQALAGGADLRFTKADDATRLPHQIDTWDTATKTATVWVRVDTVKANNNTQKIRMHWGKAGAADSSNGTAVFSNGYTNVWHLGNAAGTAGRPNAVSGGNPAVPTNFPVGYEAKKGLIGKADTLRGGPGTVGTPNSGNVLNLDRLDLGSNNINYANGMSFSIWVLPTKTGLNINFYVAASAATGTLTGTIIAGTAGTGVGAKFRQKNESTGSFLGILGSSELYADTWMHVIYTKAAGTGDMEIYRDGELVGSATEVPAFSTQVRDVNWLGVPPPGLGFADSTFAGLMDEARLANVGRSASWAKLEFDNQKAAQTLVVFDSLPVVSLQSGRNRLDGALSARASDRGVLFRVSGLNAAGARISVSDMHGRTVWSSAFPAGADQLSWTGEGASAGVYSARVELADGPGRGARVLRTKVALTR